MCRKPRNEELKRKYFALSEVADRYGLTYETIRDWIDKGWIEALRLPSNRLRIPGEELKSIEKNVVGLSQDVDEGPSTQEGQCDQ